jgi:lipid II:glycine glycyltransferase (peptidoglycan interpeptide bridge formation enzyme)
MKMAEFRFSTEAPGEWDSRCAESGAVIGTTAWQTMLESSFGCRSVYAWSDDFGAAITVFKAGPFSVGYVGFPAGSFIGNATRMPTMIGRLKSERSIPAMACLRVAISAFGTDPGFDTKGVLNPETAITHLQDWDLMSVSKNLRRDIRKAQRSGLSIDHTTDSSLGPIVYSMYESAVRHHGGSLRYNESYFTQLLEQAERNPAVRCYTAIFESDIAGFAVVVHHGDTAYYLHGGSNSELRRLSPSDLILAEAIDNARTSACKEFNFMASPPDQPMLVKYKEKWGGQTGQLRTVTIRTAASYPLFRAAEYLYSLIS